jgi:large subunit ribosomal protein L21
MLAVIELWWNQFIVRVGDIIDVKKQNVEIKSIINAEALLTSDEEWKETKIWNPTVKGSKVELKVLEQFKWEKVRVFKMKSKKRFMRNNWFRPHLTKLEVLSIW